MSDNKVSKCYIYDGTSILDDVKFSNYNYFISDKGIKAVPDSGSYPEKYTFNHVVEKIFGGNTVADSKILKGYVLRDKFKGIQSFEQSLSPDSASKDVDLELYKEDFEVKKNPDTLTEIKIYLANFDNMPVLPRWCKLEKPYSFIIHEKTDKSLYPCFVEKSSIYLMLKDEFQKLCINNSTIFTKFKEYNSNSWDYRSFSFLKKKDNWSGTEKIEIGFREQEQISGVNFEELKSRLNTYIYNEIKKRTEAPGVESQLPYRLPITHPNYFNDKGWICFKTYANIDKIQRIIKNPVVERIMKQFKATSLIYDFVFDVVKSYEAKTDYEVNFSFEGMS